MEERKALFGQPGYASGASGWGHGTQNAHTEHAHNMLEQQNDQRIEELLEMATLIKSGATEIGSIADEQNRFLDGMSRDMDKTSNLLDKTLGKLQKMAAQGGSKHMCLMIGFVVFVFVLLYLVLKRY